VAAQRAELVAVLQRQILALQIPEAVVVEVVKLPGQKVLAEQAAPVLYFSNTQYHSLQ
jgi:hypothetical protein